MQSGNQSHANPKQSLSAAPLATRAPHTKSELHRCAVGYISLQIKVNKTLRQCQLPGYVLLLSNAFHVLNRTISHLHYTGTSYKKKLNRFAGYIKLNPCKVDDLTLT